jgi:alpha-ketoglutaric semialdehyde dehydrogenase
MELKGKSLIGSQPGGEGQTFRAFEPASGAPLEPAYHSASAADVDAAAQKAVEAFAQFGRTLGAARATLLNQIAANIDALAEPLIERAHQESALPKPRLKSEVGRTSGQLRLFAKVIEEGSWAMPCIDRPDPARKPPKPDLRSCLRPIGPVVIFGASNFPLAFSVAGGDTSSALAAGNPVIVKAHPAHPGTSELVGMAIRDAVRECGMHPGVFSLLFDSGISVGAALVQHPAVKAVGFTGSLGAGRALFDLAAKRAEPIPVYAEMGSTNPVFVLPGALAARSEELATQLFASVTMGAGQFCTKPGLIFLSKQPPAAEFIRVLQEKVSQAAPFTMLTSGIRSAFARETEARSQRKGVTLTACAPAAAAGESFSAVASLFETDFPTFLAGSDLSAEVFGPSTLVVRYDDPIQLLEAARGLSGHLTATVFATVDDVQRYPELIAILENKVGRIVFNSVPTGVEVTHAMIHGGPYPASTDSRTTSVGSQSIFRFARPVCYHDGPDAALPAELQNANPLGVWRMVDGELTRQPL